MQSRPGVEYKLRENTVESRPGDFCGFRCLRAAASGRLMLVDKLEIQCHAKRILVCCVWNFVIDVFFFLRRSSCFASIDRFIPSYAFDDF